MVTPRSKQCNSIFSKMPGLIPILDCYNNLTADTLWSDEHFPVKIFFSKSLIYEISKILIFNPKAVNFYFLWLLNHFSIRLVKRSLINRFLTTLGAYSDSRCFLVHLSRRLKCTIVITRCPSSVCLSVCLSVRRPSLTFHIFDFSSETAEWNSTKLDRKQDLNVLYQVCVFRADRKNKMAALASDWLRHFRLLLWNHWMEFNETWQEARSQRPLPSVCFSGRLEKQNGRPGLWLSETFSTSSLKPLNGIQRNLIESNISTSSTKFVFYRPIGKTRWPP